MSTTVADPLDPHDVHVMHRAGDHHHAGHEHAGKHVGHHRHGGSARMAAASMLRPGVSPLWWSVPRRVGCAAVLVALLWLVIAWAAA